MDTRIVRADSVLHLWRVNPITLSFGVVRYFLHPLPIGMGNIGLRTIDCSIIRVLDQRDSCIGIICHGFILVLHLFIT